MQQPLGMSLSSLLSDHAPMCDLIFLYDLLENAIAKVCEAHNFKADLCTKKIHLQKSQLCVLKT